MAEVAAASSPTAACTAAAGIAAAALDGSASVLSSRLIVAPLVGQSDVAWRMMLRRHGAQLVYSQMIDSEKFVADEQYRKEVRNAMAVIGTTIVLLSHLLTLLRCVCLHSGRCS